MRAVIYGELKNFPQWDSDSTGYSAALEIGDAVDDIEIHSDAVNSISVHDVIDVINNVSKLIIREDIGKRLHEILKAVPGTNDYSADESIKAISAVFSSEHLNKWVRRELGGIEALDKGIFELPEDKNLGNLIKYSPMNGIVHIIDYVDAVCLAENFIAGIITKNINFFILPPSLFDFWLFIWKAVKYCDKKSLIWPHLSAAAWHLSKIKLIEALGYAGLTYNIVLPRNIFDWTEYVSFGAHEKCIKYVSGIGTAVLDEKNIRGSKGKRAAKLLADDIVAPFGSYLQVIFVQSKDIKAAHSFVERLFDELSEKESTALNGLIRTLDEKGEIRDSRETARMLASIGKGRLECPGDFSFSLIMEYEASAKYSYNKGCVYVKCVPSLKDVPERLSLLDEETGNISVCCEYAGYKSIKQGLMKLNPECLSYPGNRGKIEIGCPLRKDSILSKITKKVPVFIPEP